MVLPEVYELLSRNQKRASRRGRENVTNPPGKADEQEIPMAPLGHRRLVRYCRYPRLTWRYARWRYIDNLGPVLAHRFASRTLSDQQSSVLARVNSDGVAITSAQTLLGPDSCFDELMNAVDDLERNHAEAIAGARADFNSNNHKSKAFNFRLLGDHPLLEPSSVFTRFALQKPILEIVNSYFGMFTRLRAYNVWHTFVSKLAPQDSQLWHHDPEDNCILKVFVYLSNVDDDAGPFTYAVGTHLKGGLCRKPRGAGNRSDDKQMAEVVPPERWVRCTGPKGTIIFADTRGYHKGGFAQERDRIMYICVFTSQATKYPEMFRRPETISLPEGSAPAFAISGLV
jgi:hypothetical protein